MLELDGIAFPGRPPAHAQAKAQASEAAAASPRLDDPAAASEVAEAAAAAAELEAAAREDARLFTERLALVRTPTGGFWLRRDGGEGGLLMMNRVLPLVFLCITLGCCPLSGLPSFFFWVIFRFIRACVSPNLPLLAF